MNLLELFSTDSPLLESRGSLIIRQLCVNLNTERIYKTFAEILEKEEVKRPLIGASDADTCLGFGICCTHGPETQHYLDYITRTCGLPTKAEESRNTSGHPLT